ncbi:hypothetical protein [Mesorhizobium sp.]|uniref:hypothetical protein n=1 Tax=Mesorhizobium sp. TaxID=1871066 RepID=UPI000FE73A84|nr:hypothetical protein [Mesorhizobium sp.]RWD10415.1 MAG: hypothetical protein EOS74_29325 [Mesorhizobium sp.]RWF66289.1 MAG: hypothetical protein EOS47_06805 [Mesorhizobium sp.]
MTIAVLAWGSLVWNHGILATAAEFEPIGPLLPIEFCRVSGDGRLTLVIDEAVGSACTIYAAPSAFDALDHALQNLWKREGREGEELPRDIREHGRVGFVDRISGQASAKAIERHPRSVDTIKAWAQENNYDAAIWTALASNFHEPDRAGEPFSVGAAIRYLETLNAPKLSAALGYIRSAPSEVQTPVRAAVNVRWPEG